MILKHYLNKVSLEKHGKLFNDLWFFQKIIVINTSMNEVFSDEYPEEKSTDKQSGYDKLWNWFGLSKATFCVLPRSVMHEMPDEQQCKMAKLLDEWDDAWEFSNTGISLNNIQLRDDKGRMMHAPDWLLNYRHPNKEIINSFRVKQK